MEKKGLRGTGGPMVIRKRFSVVLSTSFAETLRYDSIMPLSKFLSRSEHFSTGFFGEQNLKSRSYFLLLQPSH